METYKTERILCLVGAIIGAVSFVFMLIVGLVVSSFSGMFELGGLIAMSIIAIIFALVSFILGFVATGKLKKGEKSGGIIAIVAAALAFVGCIVGFLPAAGYILIPCVALFLTAGIMVLAKKQIATV